jgi:hypothetical protein
MYFYQHYNNDSLDNNCIKPLSQTAKDFGGYIYSNYRINKIIQDIIFSLSCMKTKEKPAFILDKFKEHLTMRNCLMSKRQFDMNTYDRTVIIEDKDDGINPLNLTCRNETAKILTKIFLEKEPEIFKDLCKSNIEFIDLVYKRGVWKTIERTINPEYAPKEPEKWWCEEDLLLSKKNCPKFEKVVGNTRQILVISNKYQTQEFELKTKNYQCKPNEELIIEVINWVGYFGYSLIKI